MGNASSSVHMQRERHKSTDLSTPSSPAHFRDSIGGGGAGQAGSAGAAVLGAAAGAVGAAGVEEEAAEAKLSRSTKNIRQS